MRFALYAIYTFALCSVLSEAMGASPEAEEQIRRVQILQIIASVSLALASLIVAVVSVWFSYRNNFGWPPVIRFAKHIQSSPIEWEIHIQFWNRQKNAVTIRRIDIDFENLTIANVDGMWRTKDASITMPDQSTLVEGSASHEFSVRFRYRAVDSSKRFPLTINVHYYDPRRNKIVIAQQKNSLFEMAVFIPTSHSSEAYTS